MAYRRRRGTVADMTTPLLLVHVTLTAVLSIVAAAVLTVVGDWSPLLTVTVAVLSAATMSTLTVLGTVAATLHTTLVRRHNV